MNTVKGGSNEKIFPYVLYHGRYYPIVPVMVEGRERAVIHALVDSGATMSLFHKSIAEDAGIDLKDTEEVYLAGIGGYVRARVKRQVKTSIEGLRSINIPIAFTEYITSDIAILGRQGFFEAFEIIFKEWEKRLVIRSRII